MFTIKDEQHNYIILASFIIGLVYMFNNQTINTISRDFTNKTFIIYLLGISLFSIIVFLQPTKTPKQARLKEAVRKGLAALVVAYFAHLNLTFASFFIVFGGDYFLSA